MGGVKGQLMEESRDDMNIDLGMLVAYLERNWKNRWEWGMEREGGRYG